MLTKMIKTEYILLLMVLSAITFILAFSAVALVGHSDILDQITLTAGFTFLGTVAMALSRA